MFVSLKTRGEKALTLRKHGKLEKDYPLKKYVCATSLASNPNGIIPCSTATK